MKPKICQDYIAYFIATSVTTMPKNDVPKEELKLFLLFSNTSLSFNKYVNIVYFVDLLYRGLFGSILNLMVLVQWLGFHLGTEFHQRTLVSHISYNLLVLALFYQQFSQERYFGGKFPGPLHIQNNLYFTITLIIYLGIEFQANHNTSWEL